MGFSLGDFREIWINAIMLKTGYIKASTQYTINVNSFLY